MTNSSKKDSEKKAAREILDSDLDARLDQATSTLPLDDEPPSGDAIDVMLKRAKKILDSQLPADELEQALEPKTTKSKRKTSKSTDETPVAAPEEANKLVSFNDTLAKIEEDIAALHADKKADDIVQLDTPKDTTEIEALLDDSLTDDMSTLTVDDILNEVVELDAVDTNVMPVDETHDDLLDDIVELSAPADSNDILDLLDDVDTNVTPVDETHDDLLDDIVELNAPADSNDILDLLDNAETNVTPVDDIVELAASEDHNDILNLLDDIDTDVTHDDVLDNIVELTTPEDNSDILDLLDDVDTDVTPVDETHDDVLDDIVELAAPEDSNDILDLLDQTHEDEKIESFEKNNNLDDLLDSTGFDFDFDLLLDEISDELKAEISEESSAAEAEMKMDSFDDALSKNDALDTQENDAQDLIKTVESIEQPEEDSTELNVDINAALDDLMDSVPFEDILNAHSHDELNTTQEEFNNFDDVADTEATPLFEMSASEESLDDNFDEIPQLEGLDDTMENKKETASGFDLLDDNATDNAHAMPANAADDLDWLDQMGKEEEMPADAQKKADDTVATAADDDDGWITGDEDDSSVNLTKADDTVATTADDDDGWITGDEDDSSVNLTKADDTVATTADDDDGWITDDDDSSVNLTKADDTTADDDGWITDDDSVAEIEDSHEVEIDEPKPEPIKMSKEPTPAAPPPPVVAFDEAALVAKLKEELKGEKDHELARLRADQDKVEAHAKKQFAGLEDAKKKNTKLSYIALGVGIIGLIGSGGVGWMAYNSKNEEVTINEHVTQLDEKINNFLAKNPEKEIENVKNSIEQLNQKIDKLTAAQITPPVSNIITPSIAPEVAPAELTAPVAEPVTKEETKPAESKKEKEASKHNASKGKGKGKEEAKLNDETKSATTEKADSPVNLLNSKPSNEKPEVPAVTPEVNAVTPEGAKPEVKKAPEKVAEKVTEKPSETPKVEASSQKNDNAEPVKVETFDTILKESPYTGRMTRGMAFGHAKDDAEKHHNHAHKEVLNANIPEQKAAPAGKFSVNVVSYQQEWFAESKAAELRQQGIPVEVAPVDVNDSGTRYRLKVTGFKTKSEANAYASKVKKSSGFNDTWVGVNE